MYNVMTEKRSDFVYTHMYWGGNKELGPVY